MRKLTVIFIMLLGGIINAQTMFNFNCAAPLTGADAVNSLSTQTQAEYDLLTPAEGLAARKAELDKLDIGDSLSVIHDWSTGLNTYYISVTIHRAGFTPSDYYAYNYGGNNVLRDMLVGDFNDFFEAAWNYIDDNY